MSTSVISAVMAVAVTAAMGVAALNDVPPIAPPDVRVLINTNPAPVLNLAPKTSKIYIAHPYAIMVLVPGQVDPDLVHEGGHNSWKDDCVKDPHFELVPKN